MGLVWYAPSLDKALPCSIAPSAINGIGSPGLTFVVCCCTILHVLLDCIQLYTIALLYAAAAYTVYVLLRPSTIVIYQQQSSATLVAYTRRIITYCALHIPYTEHYGTYSQHTTRIAPGVATMPHTREMKFQKNFNKGDLQIVVYTTRFAFFLPVDEHGSAGDIPGVERGSRVAPLSDSECERRFLKIAKF